METRVSKLLGTKYPVIPVSYTHLQGIEIPFVNFEDIEEVKAELAKGGVKPGVCGPRVRTVTACQLSLIHISRSRNGEKPVIIRCA